MYRYTFFHKFNFNVLLYILIELFLQKPLKPKGKKNLKTKQIAKIKDLCHVEVKSCFCLLGIQEYDSANIHCV